VLYATIDLAGQPMPTYSGSGTLLGKTDFSRNRKVKNPMSPNNK